MKNNKKVIYDFGANNGDDIPYYLKKSDLVVAVEANPLLVQDMEARFAGEISAGKLIIEGCILSVDRAAADAAFYIHKLDPILSQFPQPESSRIQEFDRVSLPSANVVELVRRYGDPYYIKIDVEHYDGPILRALFESDIRPPYISAESHAIEIFSLFVVLGRYKSFNLVKGHRIARDYKKHPVKTTAGTEFHSFPHHSAGPFGDDILGPWMTPDNFFRQLALAGLGWKDIHATTEIEPDPTAGPRLREFFIEAVKFRIGLS
jgi:FkbM family methyltransferase